MTLEDVASGRHIADLLFEVSHPQFPSLFNILTSQKYKHEKESLIVVLANESSHHDVINIPSRP